MLKPFSLLLLSLFLSSAAHAFILVDPYVGYEIGSGSAGSNSFKTSGINAGLRAGWLSNAERYWLAVDYETSFDASLDYEASDRSELKKSIIFAVAGMNFVEKPFRIWAGYGIDEWVAKETSDVTYKGNAFKVGIGYTRNKPVSINFEMFNETFKEVSGAGGGADPDIKSTSYMLSVSWPLKY